MGGPYLASRPITIRSIKLTSVQRSGWPPQPTGPLGSATQARTCRQAEGNSSAASKIGGAEARRGEALAAGLTSEVEVEVPTAPTVLLLLELAASRGQDARSKRRSRSTVDVSVHRTYSIGEKSSARSGHVTRPTLTSSAESAKLSSGAAWTSSASSTPLRLCSPPLAS